MKLSQQTNIKEFLQLHLASAQEDLDKYNIDAVTVIECLSLSQNLEKKERTLIFPPLPD